MFIRSWNVVCHSNPSLRSTPSQDLQLTGESQMVLRTEQWTERGGLLSLHLMACALQQTLLASLMTAISFWRLQSSSFYCKPSSTSAAA